MPVTVAVNAPETVVHKGSMGVVQTQMDVCKTPSPGGPVPVPYPNMALSSQVSGGSKSVTVEGNSILLKGSCINMSSGDEAGSAGGVASGCIKGKAEPVLYSFDVKVEGKNVVRRSDPMTQNKGNCF
ncbi:DUF4150 domain-containing protein [Archangium minus]|uniref:DUF4150 domain-containing protein n=1 Tax=Archangium minus TaxID=83450 RepID=A0ABY9X840_9BACT|nr:DUF4150 domain-containing protein [Archangium minus]